MDGGGEGITPVSNIPQQCSGRDHRNLNKQRRREQNRERGGIGVKNWKLMGTKGGMVGEKRNMRKTKGKPFFYFCELYFYESVAYNTERV